MIELEKGMCTACEVGFASSLEFCEEWSMRLEGVKVFTLKSLCRGDDCRRHIKRCGKLGFVINDGDFTGDTIVSKSGSWGKVFVFAGIFHGNWLPLKKSFKILFCNETRSQDSDFSLIIFFVHLDNCRLYPVI